MSDWYRNDRDDEQRRYGQEDRGRRDLGGERGRWSGQAGQGRDGQEGRSFGETGQGGYGGGQAWRGGQGGYRGEGGYGGQDYRRQSYGGQGGRFLGGNERVQEVTDGEADRGFRAQFGGDQQRAGEHRGRGPKNYTRSDDRIREDVNDRLSDDSWLDASEIEVQVSQCEVTLTGTVNSRDDKRRAEDIAEQISGVKHVQNNLRVQDNRDQNTRWTSASGQAGSTGATGVQTGSPQAGSSQAGAGQTTGSGRSSGATN
ncbi:MAG: BON domain-containing protein [Phenylobacterium sp.]